MARRGQQLVSPPSAVCTPGLGEPNAQGLTQSVETSAPSSLDLANSDQSPLPAPTRELDPPEAEFVLTGLGPHGYEQATNPPVDSAAPEQQKVPRDLVPSAHQSRPKHEERQPSRRCLRSEHHPMLMKWTAVSVLLLVVAAAGDTLPACNLSSSEYGHCSLRQRIGDLHEFPTATSCFSQCTLQYGAEHRSAANPDDRVYNGGESCEGHGFNAQECAQVGCCEFDDNECWSTIAEAPCVPPTRRTGPMSLPTYQAGDFEPVWVDGEGSRSGCGKTTRIFGVWICATPAAWQNKVRCDHIAEVLAQLLDNDADGVADDPELVEYMVATGLWLWVPIDEFEINSVALGNFGNFGDPYTSQALWVAEAIPNSCDNPINRGATANRSSWIAVIGQAPGTADCNPERDASTEEVLHLLHRAAEALHPSMWGANHSAVQTAIVATNGDCGWGYQGNWTDPGGANPQCTGQFAYHDHSCDERCIVHEGLYWASTSYMGGLMTNARAYHVSDEWLMTVPDASMEAAVPAGLANARTLQQGAPTLYDMVSHTGLDGHKWLPSTMPNGKYKITDPNAKYAAGAGLDQVTYSKGGLMFAEYWDRVVSGHERGCYCSWGGCGATHSDHKVEGGWIMGVRQQDCPRQGGTSAEPPRAASNEPGLVLIQTCRDLKEFYQIKHCCPGNNSSINQVVGQMLQLTPEQMLQLVQVGRSEPWAALAGNMAPGDGAGPQGGVPGMPGMNAEMMQQMMNSPMMQAAAGPRPTSRYRINDCTDVKVLFKNHSCCNSPKDKKLNMVFVHSSQRRSAPSSSSSSWSTPSLPLGHNLRGWRWRQWWRTQWRRSRSHRARRYADPAMTRDIKSRVAARCVADCGDCAATRPKTCGFYRFNACCADKGDGGVGSKKPKQNGPADSHP